MIYNYFWNHVDDGSVLRGGAKKTSSFKVAKRIKLDSILDVRHYPQIELDHENNEALRFRIDFVPKDLGMDGLEELHMALMMFLPEGWGNFVSSGKITRLDVTVDFPDQTMPNWLFLPHHLATKTVWRSKGTIETYQLGKPNGNLTQIYDRKAKRTAKGGSHPDKVGMRVERRLRNPSVRLKDLHALNNPFSTLSVCKAISHPPPQEAKPYIWNLFLCAVERDGLPVALGLLPADKRKVYRDYYKTHIASWWDPESIWQRWPQYLAETHIGDVQYWCTE